jgi:polysaccharide export outer membrane protein
VRCRFATALVLSIGLIGCSHLPSSAPTVKELKSAETTDGKLNFFLVDIDPQVAAALAGYRSPGFATSFGVGGYQPTLTLHPGDTVAITIFEVSSPLALFAPPQQSPAPERPTLPPGTAAPERSSTLPAQVIELDGTVNVPFAGRVRIAGMTPAQAGRQVERALEGKALQPQAIVTLVSTVTELVTVGGSVGRPGPIALTVRGERVLDVIAAAGGAKYESYDSDVQLVRRGRAAIVNMRRIVDDPAENVRVQPGDSIYVSYDPRSYSVLGSALKVSHYNFGYERVNLAEAIAQAGGSTDNLSNIGGIYLLRYEPKELVGRILSPNDPRRSDLPTLAAEGRYPVAYHVNLRQAQGYFLSQAVQMRDKDTILITNADTTELQKILAIVRNITGIYFDLKRSTAISP